MFGQLLITGIGLLIIALYAASACCILYDLTRRPASSTAC
jgi:hypothetical protein